MKETTKIVSQQEALHKYQYSTHRGDGTCEVRVRYRSDGSEDPSCCNMKYRTEHEKAANEEEEESARKQKAKKPKTPAKGYFGMSRWNPICWIIWIVLLPFKLIWAILKLVLKILGIMAIINFFKGDD
ncbi:MAG: hypothetical protein HDS73_05100 [Bacteroidales bacterium]|nr:hypothetical protein [Bacteroidales bacterium]